MLSDLDAALKNYLQNETIPGQSVQVALDPPTKDWAARRTGAVLNLFLADIREDVDRRDVNLREITNDQGVVVARQQANRFYLVTYLLTAWTSTPEDDHRLLGLALVAMLRQDYLPFEYVTGDLSVLVGAGFPLTTRVGLRAMNERTYSEMMTAVGAEYRPPLSIIISMPVQTGTPEAAGPPQTVPPVVSIGDTRSGASTTAQGPDPEDPGAGYRTRTRPTSDVSAPVKP
ncbi:unannotated protein [freshwater metagenome]|uniref:Unannotated protein n=1 Tax=freshwater metagenome TaxID=449393 RepID=A0A6J6PV44_9ZZZZ|nr:DUF4255 domain-containing protein [Actinomycetota bacterium]MSY16773.1 DUF4255 domain-containing protein [Actinomycetota bacterium]